MSGRRFRRRVTWMSFILSILVVWIHAYNAELFLGTLGAHEAARIAEIWVGERIAQIAVPGFFMLSSYLFFRGYTLERLPRKMLRRVWSLLIPYLAWNFLYYAGYFIGSRIPVFSDMVNKGKVPFSAGELFRAVFLFSFNPVFWFVFQLIILVAVSPLLYYAVRRADTAVIFLGFVLVLVAFRADLPLVNEDALFYYSAAAAVACHGRRFIERRRPERYFTPFLCFFAGALVLYYVYSRTGNDLPLVLSRFFGASALWLFLSILPLPAPRPYMYHSFMLYAMHFALVRFINKAAAVVFSGSEAAAMIIYLLMPGLMIIIVSLVSSFLKCFLPGLYTILSGGRR